MSRHERTNQPASGLSPAELADFLRAEPPAFLDELVKQRMGSVLEQRRTALAEQQAEVRRPDGRAPAVPIGAVEAGTFALGVLAYGVQLADGVARMLWRALTG